jgi:tetratricopeptide (TPR) repeat protein
MRRGLLHLAAVGAPGSAALADLQEGHKLQGSPATAQALALGLLGVGKAAEALQLLTPIVDINPNDPRLLGAYGRALRETGQLVESRQTLQKAEALVTAAGAAPVGANVGLRAALRQELAVTLMALKKPVEALRQLDGTDEATQQLRAQANLVSARALFEQASTPVPGPLGGVATAAPRGTPDIHQVMFVTQAALTAGPAVLPVQRAEAKLWQVHVLHGTGQDELASKLLAEMAAAFDQPTLDSLLGPGGFAILQSRITLRGGEFYQGTTIAQQAIPRLPRDAARSLQNALAFGYTSKAVEIANRGEYERANALFRAAVLYSQGGPPGNMVRAQYNLAVLQILRNHPEEARGVLTKLDPQQLPEALIGLGAYHDAAGDPRQALEAYRRYVQLLAASPAVPRPPYAEKVQQLGRIYDLPVRGSLSPPVTAGRERPRPRPTVRPAAGRLPAAKSGATP